MRHISIYNNTVFGAIVCFALFLCGCKESIMTYDGEAGVYFAMLRSGETEDNPRYDSTSMIPFALTLNSMDTVFKLKVKVIGAVVDYPREFSYRVVEDKTTAVANHDYVLPTDKCVVPADSIYGYIPIKFLRQPSLSGNEIGLTIELIENSEFGLPIKGWLAVNGTETNSTNVVEHTIMVSDKYVRLDGWSDLHYGKFSEKKIRIMCNEFKLTLADFMPNALSFVEKVVLGENFRKYLLSEEQAGRTIYEEYRDDDGNLVKMESGEASQPK